METTSLLQRTGRASKSKMKNYLKTWPKTRKNGSTRHHINEERYHNLSPHLRNRHITRNNFLKNGKNHHHKSDSVDKFRVKSASYSKDSSSLDGVDGISNGTCDDLVVGSFTR